MWGTLGRGKLEPPRLSRGPEGQRVPAAATGQLPCQGFYFGKEDKFCNNILTCDSHCGDQISYRKGSPRVTKATCAKKDEKS